MQVKEYRLCHSEAIFLFGCSYISILGKRESVGEESTDRGSTEKHIPRCRLTMQRYISVPRFEVLLVTQSVVSYCLTRWSSWCKRRKFSSSDSGRVSASSDCATVTTSRNSAVTTSLTNRIALQTEEPCIELEWVVVMPSVVWQLCAIDYCQRVGVYVVRSCVIGHRSELGHVLVFCQRNWWPRWEFVFVLLTGNWVDLNHLFQTNTVIAEPEGSSLLIP